MPVNDLITIRKGTASQWSCSNPTLASGEPGYESDTGLFKIGNGSSAWNSLSYSSVIPSGLIGGSNINISLGSNGSTATIGVSGLNSIASYSTTSNFPATGSTSVYYLATDTSRLYQWTGSQYVEVGPPMGGIANAQAAINLYLWSNFR